MRRLAGVAALLMFASAWVPGAHAVAGSISDGDDSASKLDIKTASHSDSSSQITLSLDFYESWTATTVPYYELLWLFDFNGDDQVDGCILVGEGEQPYEFVLLKGDCDDGNPQPTAVAEGTAARSSETSLSVTTTIANMRTAGLAEGAGSYRYQAFAFDNSANPTDRVPDSQPATHALGEASAASQSAATANPSTLAAGRDTTIAGSGFAPNTPLTATLFSDPVVLKSFTSDGAGRFSTTVTIPATTLPGTHRLVVSGRSPSGGNHESAVTLTIVLPETGPSSSTERTSATGAALAALGFALLMLAYYERHRASMAATRLAGLLKLRG